MKDNPNVFGTGVSIGAMRGSIEGILTPPKVDITYGLIGTTMGFVKDAMVSPQDRLPQHQLTKVL